eukprot:m.184051 g.184051  ORF g.184051 m.184051 type:complete len:337 (+) comp18488_c0_seq16:203-1213(+)
MDCRSRWMHFHGAYYFEILIPVVPFACYHGPASYCCGTTYICPYTTRSHTPLFGKFSIGYLLFSAFTMCRATCKVTLACSRQSLPQCRCVPPSPCWDSIPWESLNSTVGGKLMRLDQPLVKKCGGDKIASPACAKAVAGLDDEFTVTGLPNAYMHTGLFNVWNTSMNLPTYAVAAKSEADIQNSVKFAVRHNLRLVVKATGHDWYGRSAAAGALMIWTHLRKNITAIASWTPEANRTSRGVPAVTVESGVQFSDLYLWGMQHGHLVIGGTCDSVGVGGCWLGGCYGTWSKLYGSAASNLLQAKVVLANGTLVVTNKESHPELFWSLRGGGGGVAGW